MINVVMLVHGRKKLTEQALHSLFRNTPTSDYCLTVVGDNTTEILYDFIPPQDFGVMQWCATNRFNHVTGALKNFGVHMSIVKYGRGDWLYLADNDSYFLPGWSERLIATYEANKRERFLLIGGSNHPYHKHLSVHYHARLEHNRSAPTLPEQPELVSVPTLYEYSALAGTSWLMKWATWDKYGPLLETGAPGPCNGEDHEFCQKIRADGGKVGAVWPEVVLDCGITQSNGNPSPGAESKRRVEGIYYE